MFQSQDKTLNGFLFCAENLEPPLVPGSLTGVLFSKEDPTGLGTKKFFSYLFKTATSRKLKFFAQLQLVFRLSENAWVVMDASSTK